MNRTVLAISAAVIASCALVGCGGEASDQPGSPAVYDRIAGLTDCSALQHEFDVASTNHDRASAGSRQAQTAAAYMEAADDRMKQLDCY